MVGSKPGVAVSQPALSQFPVEIVLYDGEKNQSSNEWTGFLHSGELLGSVHRINVDVLQLLAYFLRRKSMPQR